MPIYLGKQRINTVVSTQTSEIQPEISAVTSDIEWNAEWEERGLEGTKYDIVVGDSKAPLLSVAIMVINKNSNDPCTVDWGDGDQTVSTKSTGQQRLYHEYDEAGNYVQ